MNLAQETKVMDSMFYAAAEKAFNIAAYAEKNEMKMRMISQRIQELIKTADSTLSDKMKQDLLALESYIFNKEVNK